MNKLESRLANQSDSESLNVNEACDMNFTRLKVTGMVSRITFCRIEMGNPCVKTCQFLASKIHLRYTLSHEIITTDQPLSYN